MLRFGRKSSNSSTDPDFGRKSAHSSSGAEAVKRPSAGGEAGSKSGGGVRRRSSGLLDFSWMTGSRSTGNAQAASKDGSQPGNGSKDGSQPGFGTWWF